MSNQENKFDKDERAARPQTIAGALGRLFKRLGVRASDSDLVSVGSASVVVFADVGTGKSFCSFFIASEIRTNVPLQPGTAPSTKTRFSASSVPNTFKF